MLLTPTKAINHARRQVSRLARENPASSPWGLVALAAAEIRKTAPELIQTLTPALLKGWVDAARKLAREARVERSGSPPVGTWRDLVPLGPADPVRWPAIEASVQDLVSRQLVTWPEYQLLTEQAQATAFSVARVLTEEGVERVRNAVSKTVAEGMEYKQFEREVGPVMAEAGLAGHRVETIFRTSVGQAQGAGMRKVLQHPSVAAEFPYVAYHAVHDSRTGDRDPRFTTPTHRMMEKLGIQKTNIYRADDPVILRHWPPWRWNCRCQVIPLSIEDAAAAGIREAMLWHRTWIPPVSPAWVPNPPFGLPPGWPSGGTGIRPIVP